MAREREREREREKHERKKERKKKRQRKKGGRKACSSNHVYMKNTYRCVFFLACCVEDVHLYFFAIDRDLFAIAICGGGVVFFGKVTIHELQC
jgi:hypothetical protein